MLTSRMGRADAVYGFLMHRCLEQAVASPAIFCVPCAQIDCSCHLISQCNSCWEFSKNGIQCVIITLEMGRFSCESGIWEHSAQCTRLEENHQLRLNSSVPSTEVHCLLGPQPRNSTEDRDFLFSRHIKYTSLKGKGGKRWKRRATWLIWKESMLALTLKH